MKLRGIVSEGGGACNEDAAGIVEHEGEVTAAWVFDGVTGINDGNYLEAASDAKWIVERAEQHLRELAAQDIPLIQLLATLVDKIASDWKAATRHIVLPEGHDVPACCLLLAKRYGDGWKALRLGDSILLTTGKEVQRWDGPQTALGSLESLIRDEAKRLRTTGVTDFNALLQRFRPQLMASRRARNTTGNHSVLVADRSALAQPELIELGWPEEILLCSDGFYRAVDTYHMLDDAALVATCSAPGGMTDLLRKMRLLEADDPFCEKYMRFKPADDASAVMLCG